MRFVISKDVATLWSRELQAKLVLEDLYLILREKKSFPEIDISALAVQSELHVIYRLLAHEGK